MPSAIFIIENSPIGVPLRAMIRRSCPDTLAEFMDINSA
jgi:hypothetical protein